MTELPHHRALLASVDWPSLETALDDPLDAALLAGMTDPDPAVQEEATDRMLGAVCHQNTVYGATPPVARYAAAILGELPDAPRLRLLKWLGEAAHDADDESADCELEWITAEDDYPAFWELRGLRPELFAAVRPFLTDADPDVREAALVAALPLSEHPDLADLRPELAEHAERLLATSTDRFRRDRALEYLRAWGRDTAALESAEDRAAEERRARLRAERERRDDERTAGGGGCFAEPPF
ncbi:hypothetical protein ACFY00_22450 [Kitasatospora sp. NPDC001540]|uniref:hypothetical protein n=1 Tax=Kitasatospora sp. NPDC001540 TaxID=3364014 RepID=UPI0036919A8A